MTQREIDERYMRRCLQLAECGRMGAKPNPMVGAVTVAGGRIIGEGFHIRCGEGHAEVNAFASVRPEDERLLPEATIYVSLEPCAHYGKTPPCADLIVSKGVRRCVVGCIDTFAKVSGRGVERLREAGMEVEVGVLEEECRWLNRRFFTYNRERRPYIIMKWAQSLDGFIDEHFQPTAFSTPFTQMLSHRLRAEEDAILVGRVTDERDRPRLSVRHWSGPNPKRFVLSHGMDLRNLMGEMFRERVQSLIVEGGAMTHRSFIDAGLWDELRVETAPRLAHDGTKAAALPKNAILKSHQLVDGNTIDTYVRQA